MKSADVDWKNPVDLIAHIHAQGGRSTPLMLERLLEHCGFEEVGALPTRNSWTAVMWAHRDRATFKELRRFQFVVHHPETLDPAVVLPMLAALREAIRVAIGCGALPPGFKF